MYWYIKYPLLMLLGALLATVGWWALHRVGTRQGGAATPPPAAAQVQGARPPAPPVATPPAVAPAEAARQAALERLARQLAAAEGFLGQGQWLQARAAATAVLAAPEVTAYDPFWHRAAGILTRANLSLFNSDLPMPEKIRITVKSGDTLIGLARRHQTTVAALERQNKLDTARTTIYPGMVLHVMPPQFAITVLKNRFVLLLHNGEALFAYWRVGIGRQNRTPVGSFVVNSRLQEPVWTPPGQVIPYGDPRNVLGTHWLGLAPAAGTDPALKGFGIHGTWEPDSIGTAASEGCVRMRNADIAALFAMIPNGTPVTIRDE
ncbi:MAG: L,D-transpeptidase family protein [Lentisphaeria bacterium]|jgi:lipoprotein-anchoring transpeptidase ErfK/SrfK